MHITTTPPREGFSSETKPILLQLLHQTFQICVLLKDDTPTCLSFPKWCTSAQMMQSGHSGSVHRLNYDMENEFCRYYTDLTYSPMLPNTSSPSMHLCQQNVLHPREGIVLEVSSRAFALLLRGKPPLP